MNIIKKFSILAAGCALSLTLASCNNNNDKASESTSTDTSTETVQKSTDKDSMKVLKYVDIGTPPKDLAKVNEKINEYLDSQKAGYHMELIFWDWGDYEQKIQLASNTGEDWDLAFSASWAGPYATMAEKGAFLDITDLIKDKPNITKQLTDDVIKGASIDGKLYGVPGAAENVVAGDYFVWNKQYVDKYKIPYDKVKSLKDLEPYLKEVKEKEASVEYPLAVANDWGIVTTPVPQNVVVSGISVVEKDGKLTVENQFADPEYREEVDVMKDYMDKGYITPDAPQAEAGQKYAGDSWLVTKAEGDPGSNGIWKGSFGTDVVSYPIGENVLISNDKVQGKLVCINSQTENQKEALDFIDKMFSSKELQNILCYGIEGEHYNIENGKVSRTDKYMNYDVPAFTFISAYTQTPLKDQIAKGDAEYDKAIEDYKQKLKPSPLLGFTLDRKDIDSEIINIEQIYSEYKKNIQTGAFDDDYYKEFLKRLDDAGIEKVIKETQKQIDQWNK
ncbi:MAG: ABC transporter substrate-binding protein [Peptoniphilaceae bacterium]|nr:ABC transporter substrate-binding protein [Peptoniphilaceae bacterium]MDY6019253.1 ABC transporter substrate-binding protein [Anaerococcus sp.]